MPRKYNRKTQRAAWSSEKLIQAVNLVEYGTRIKTAATMTGIPRATLMRYLKKREPGQVIQKSNLGHGSILGHVHEERLSRYLKRMESFGFGLTPLQVRSVAFEYCEVNKIPHNFKKDSKLAGEDWFACFMRRNSDLSLRKPEQLSKQRSMGLNEKQVNKFYEILKPVLEEFGFENHPETIYNEDEAGFSLVQDPPKIVGEKGKNQVCAITIAEKGATTTYLACASATGEWLPPFIVFKGVRMQEALNSGFPHGTVVKLSENGWSNKDIFLDFLKIFSHHCRRTPAGYSLLILDGHNSHADSYAALLEAERLKIVMVCLPPHTSHAMQPLDVGVFKTFKSNWNGTLQRALLAGSTISRYSFGKFFNETWLASAKRDNVVRAFESTGIHPFNDQKIRKERFAPSVLSERPLEVASSENNPQLTEDVPPEIGAEIEIGAASPVAPVSPELQTEPELSSLLNRRRTNMKENSELLRTFDFESILPPPKILRKPQKEKVSKKTVTRVLTSFDNMEAQRVKESLKTSTPKRSSYIFREKTVLNKTSKRLPRVEFDSNKPCTSKQAKVGSENENECCVCGSPYAQSTVDWLQCLECLRWACEDCYASSSCANCAI